MFFKSPNKTCHGVVDTTEMALVEPVLLGALNRLQGKQVMSKQTIQQTIAHLRMALSVASDLSSETRAAMQAELDRLDDLLSRDQLTPEQMQPVAGQLQELLLTFETKHPQITGLIGTLASSLANLGI